MLGAFILSIGQFQLYECQVVAIIAKSLIGMYTSYDILEIAQWIASNSGVLYSGFATMVS